MAVTVIAANLSRPAIREPGDHCRFADPRLISDFEAVATAAALPFDKASSNHRGERRSATTRLDMQPMRAPLERIPVRLLERGLPGGASAAHGYPD
jgi:hypothetical protein